nr:preprotein translocase subunit SecG [Maliibacterium massiliense]
MLTVIEIIATVLLALISIALIVVVMMQDSASDGIGALGGSTSDTFMNRSQTKSRQQRLVMYTRIGGIALVVLSIAMVLMQKFGG